MIDCRRLITSGIKKQETFSVFLLSYNQSGHEPLNSENELIKLDCHQQ